jgi:hypothetical protein
VSAVTGAVTGIVSYIRCRVCKIEQTVIGPAAMATYEYPGWQVNLREFYKPSGDHYCPRHIPSESWW